MKNGAAYVSLVLLLTALPVVAQSQQSSGDTAAGAKPSTTSGTARENGQNNTAAEKKKLKKVWTNEEINSVNGTISVVGEGEPSGNSSSTGKSTLSADGDKSRQKQVENYRNAIHELQSQMDATDKRIEQLKNFKGENTSPSGGLNPNGKYNMVPLADQLKEQEEKKKKLQAKMDGVESEARKNGIEPGELR